MVQKTKKVTGKKAIKKTVEEAIEKEYGYTANKSVKEAQKEMLSEDVNLGGRPAHFENKEDLEKAIESYFAECPDYRYIKLRDGDKGEQLEKVPNPTITGLAYHIGFESRQSFYDYEKRGEFSYIIKRARLKIESQYEAKLSDAAPTGAIFALKNMNWNETTIVESRNTNVNVEAKASETPVDKMTDEQKADIQDQLKQMGFATTNDFLTEKVVEEDGNKETE